MLLRALIFSKQPDAYLLVLKRIVLIISSDRWVSISTITNLGTIPIGGWEEKQTIVHYSFPQIHFKVTASIYFSFEASVNGKKSKIHSLITVLLPQTVLFSSLSTLAGFCSAQDQWLFYFRDFQHSTFCSTHCWCSNDRKKLLNCPPRRQASNPGQALQPAVGIKQNLDLLLELLTENHPPQAKPTCLSCLTKEVPWCSASNTTIRGEFRRA